MTDKISFKDRVAQAAIQNAITYKNNFLDYEYLFCSEAFEKHDYYIISANADNYRHLLGVNTSLSAIDFFNKCINGDLTSNDFDFNKKNRSEKEVKGSVRKKIKALPYFVTMFDKELMVQEDFTKNRVSCAFATSDCNFTAGFVCSGASRPMTLLGGDELDWSKVNTVDLVLRKKRDDELFGNIIFGDSETLKKYYPKIKHLVTAFIESF